MTEIRHGNVFVDGKFVGFCYLAMNDLYSVFRILSNGLVQYIGSDWSYESIIWYFSVVYGEE